MKSRKLWKRWGIPITPHQLNSLTPLKKLLFQIHPLMKVRPMGTVEDELSLENLLIEAAFVAPGVVIGWAENETGDHRQ